MKYEPTCHTSKHKPKAYQDIIVRSITSNHIPPSVTQLPAAFIAKILFKSLLALAAAPGVMACALHARTYNSSNGLPPDVMGPDVHPDPETLGIFVNHFALNVNNLTRSRDFYTDVFGMRHMFTHYLSEHITVTYLTHSQGGRNGTGWESTEELLRYKNNNGGHIELLNMDTPGKDIPGTPKQTSLFNHVGIIVPNPEAVQKRLEKHRVPIYKKIGEPMPTDGPMANPYSLGDASHLSKEEFEVFNKNMAQLNALNIFAEDPDGNLLEILPLNEPPLFG